MQLPVRLVALVVLATIGIAGATVALLARGEGRVRRAVTTVPAVVHAPIVAPAPAHLHDPPIGRPAPATPPADDSVDLAADRLPAQSAWALPPIINLTARPVHVADAARLRRVVLRSGRFALAPQARRNLLAGRVSPSALALLAQFPRLGAPVLVFDLSWRDLRVQTTTLWMTRRSLRTLTGLTGIERPQQLWLRSVSPSTIDVAAPHGGDLGAQAVAIAERFLGIPYVWGGETPTGGFDCSGLTKYVYAKLGVHLDHYAAWQFLEGKRISVDQLQPGDLVFFHPKPDGPGHVGIYIGGGEMIHAPHTGDVVRITNIIGRAGYLGAVRPY